MRRVVRSIGAPSTVACFRPVCWSSSCRVIIKRRRCRRRRYYTAPSTYHRRRLYRRHSTARLSRHCQHRTHAHTRPRGTMIIALPRVLFNRRPPPATNTHRTSMSPLLKVKLLWKKTKNKNLRKAAETIRVKKYRIALHSIHYAMWFLVERTYIYG